MVTESYNPYYPGYNDPYVQYVNVIARTAVIYSITTFWQKYGESKCNFDVAINKKWCDLLDDEDNIYKLTKW